MDTIAGTVAVVTGAASGIGLSIAQALSSAGGRVALLDVDAEALKRAAASIPNTSAFVVDVSERTAMYETADRVRAALGPVAILVNNAGIAYNRTPLWETADADIDWSFAINVFGVLHGIKAYVPEMVRNGRGGHVVNTSSIGGFQVRPTNDFHQTLYAATKYAVTALSGIRATAPAASTPLRVPCTWGATSRLMPHDPLGSPPTRHRPGYPAVTTRPVAADEAQSGSQFRYSGCPRTDPIYLRRGRPSWASSGGHG